MDMKKNQGGVFADAMMQSIVKLSPLVQVREPGDVRGIYWGDFIDRSLALGPCRNTGRARGLYPRHRLDSLVHRALRELRRGDRGGARPGRRPIVSERRVKTFRRGKLKSAANHDDYVEVVSATLRRDDVVFVKVGETIPMDGEVIEGAASVDESAITGESAPVIRESGGDRSAVTGGYDARLRLARHPGYRRGGRDLPR